LLIIVNQNEFVCYLRMLAKNFRTHDFMNKISLSKTEFYTSIKIFLKLSWKENINRIKCLVTYVRGFLKLYAWETLKYWIQIRENTLEKSRLTTNVKTDTYTPGHCPPKPYFSFKITKLYGMTPLP
jgi:hypothetical protein